ncbi:HYC_CC_PP family protein [Marinifilum caeruleilacunae]|uniref:Uncharacterized protein n=1 Tax=Marinifilum caeruleilacunae TaxID=2499076 RepID=A0ABX1WXK1_9BACT|nr:hypothetical protein [Marinifilum caeruleilacunae]NOU60804.1 hypothetical protein [Marinifilum caeruleilacunae]
MKTKKFVHITMVFLLLISTAGVSINKHYSGGEIFSTAFFIEADSCCETPCACCNESTDFIQVDADYLATAYDLVEVAQFDLLFAYKAVPVVLESATNILNNFRCEDSPPPFPDLCVVNQVFRL